MSQEKFKKGNLEDKVSKGQEKASFRKGTKMKDVKFTKDKKDLRHGVDAKEQFPKRNDPAFYTKYRELATNAARIAFNHRNGSKIQFQYGSTPRNLNLDPVMVLPYVPTPGLSNAKTSGINVAANAAYKVLNRKYRGSPSGRYQSADLGIAQFGIMDFYLSLAQAERVYGLCQEAKVNQRLIPRELVFSLGFDYDNISNNLADFRAKLNTIIVRAQVLCLVKGYPFMSHHLFLLSNVFKDKDTARANYFAYTKPGYWKWVPTEFTTGSALKWCTNKATHRLIIQLGNPRYFNLQTIDDVIANLTEQLDPLLNDSDIDAISADILALFENSGDSDLLKLSFLPDGYTVDPIFSQDALYQLHNTIVCGSISTNGARGSAYATADDVNLSYASEYPTSLIPTGDSASNHTGLYIYQVDDCIHFNVVCATDVSLTQSQSANMVVYGTTSNMSSSQIYYPVIDTDILNPTPDEVLEMTRNTTVWETLTFIDNGTTYYRNRCRAMGTVMPVNFRIFEFYTVGEFTINANGDYTPNSATVYQDNSLNWNVPKSRYDWFPITCTSQGSMYADLDNYRGIEFPILETIHEAAVLSEFHNPISDILIKDI